MTNHITRKQLEEIAADRGVSNVELETLWMALEGKSIDEIAQQEDITPVAIRKRLGKAYQKFGLTGTGPGKLVELKYQIESKYQMSQTQEDTKGSVALAKLETEDVRSRQDWDEELDVDLFYGREEELATLRKWIIAEKCRLIAIYGMVSIGKTALAVKLAKNIEGNFDYLIWRSLRNQPKPDLLLEDLLKFLPKLDGKKVSPDFRGKVSQLIECLKNKRCLLILDQVEAILRPGTKIGRYLEGYEGYGELLRRIGQEEHQSCLVITTQEKIREINLLEGSDLPIRSFQLKELKESEAKEIFESKGLSGKERWSELIKVYKGNPLFLKRISQIIQEVFSGNVIEFLEFKTLSGSSIFDILLKIIQRVSPLEKEILACLTKEENAMSFQELKNKLSKQQTKLSTSEVMSAIESLGGRSLIEKSTIKKQDKTTTVFTPDPLLKQYLIRNQGVLQQTRKLEASQSE